ncbi:hypothetical protein PAPYR_3986 [Paratrimastix pyriformis]|uniref:Uncharacterized protein n=1 Tax=Paratrimastix pyriformis TaxID=342808 RepID=A0ABQ8UN84_9EUKA|nr:hypothetical protein PAPYR_3986 [Paratrimastix pyriformis]
MPSTRKAEVTVEEILQHLNFVFSITRDLCETWRDLQPQLGVSVTVSLKALFGSTAEGTSLEHKLEKFSETLWREIQADLAQAYAVLVNTRQLLEDLSDPKDFTVRFRPIPPSPSLEILDELSAENRDLEELASTMGNGSIPAKTTQGATERKKRQRARGTLILWKCGEIWKVFDEIAQKYLELQRRLGEPTPVDLTFRFVDTTDHARPLSFFSAFPAPSARQRVTVYAPAQQAQCHQTMSEVTALVRALAAHLGCPRGGPWMMHIDRRAARVALPAPAPTAQQAARAPHPAALSPSGPTHPTSPQQYQQLPPQYPAMPLMPVPVPVPVPVPCYMPACYPTPVAGGSYPARLAPSPISWTPAYQRFPPGVPPPAPAPAPPVQWAPLPNWQLVNCSAYSLPPSGPPVPSAVPPTGFALNQRLPPLPLHLPPLPPVSPMAALSPISPTTSATGSPSPPLRTVIQPGMASPPLALNSQPPPTPSPHPQPPPPQSQRPQAEPPQPGKPELPEGDGLGSQQAPAVGVAEGVMPTEWDLGGALPMDELATASGWDLADPEPLPALCLWVGSSPFRLSPPGTAPAGPFDQPGAAEEEWFITRGEPSPSLAAGAGPMATCSCEDDSEWTPRGAGYVLPEEGATRGGAVEDEEDEEEDEEEDGVMRWRVEEVLSEAFAGP